MGHLDVSYEVACWFMDQGENEVRVCRAWMRLRPGPGVAIHHPLRQSHLDAIDGDEFPQVQEEGRAVLYRGRPLPRCWQSPLDGSLTEPPRVIDEPPVLQMIKEGRALVWRRPKPETVGWRDHP